MTTTTTLPPRAAPRADIVAARGTPSATLGATVETPSWIQRYANKVRTPREALSSLGHGSRVFVGSGAAEPQTLVNTLAELAYDLEDTEIVHILTLGVAPYADPRLADLFRHNAFFIGPNVRQAVSEGRADYTPIFLHEVGALFRTGQVQIDVALIMVSPPDEHGWCSYGVSVDVVKPATESARVVIAQINRYMPRTLGDSFIHVSQIDVLVPADEPLLELSHGPTDQTAQRIGKHIADLIEDGSTLQLGIGTIPDAIVAELRHKHDLGIHTEMLSDGVLPLVRDGIVTNARKSLHRGKILATFAMGTRALYDFVHDNPMCEFRPNEYANDPFVIAQNDRMVSINAALEVDLTGQVCADSLGEYFYSGIGGQVDFVRGAARSKGGKPIIALPATAQGGTVSRIVSTLKPGAGVVTSRGDVHYVVTEFGVAYLHGKSIRERAMALISVAHPDFRSDLLAAAKERRMVYLDQTVKTLAPHYPEELTHTFTTAAGQQVRIRPLRATDEPLLRAMFYRLTDATIYHRFFGYLKSMPHNKLKLLLEIDYQQALSLVAVVGEIGAERMIGLARYDVDPATRYAEAAFLVEDEFQNQNIGTELLVSLTQAARDRGVIGFTADVLADNQAMLRLFYKSGETIHSHFDDGIYSIWYRFCTCGKRDGVCRCPQDPPGRPAGTLLSTVDGGALDPAEDGSPRAVSAEPPAAEPGT